MKTAGELSLQPAVINYLTFGAGQEIRTLDNGRLVVDAPTGLPEGTVLDLVVDDEGDELGEDERAALNAAISHAWAAANAGQVRSADEVLKALRKR